MKWVRYAGLGLSASLLVGIATLWMLSHGNSRLEAHVEIEQPPEVVFTWVTEPERVKRWLGWLKEIRPVTPQQDVVGARQIWVMEDRNNGNQLMEIDTELVSYDEPRSVTSRLTAAEGFTGTVSYDLQPVGAERTRVRYVGSYEFEHWLAKLLEPVITRSAQQKLEEDLARLKREAEMATAGMAIK